MIYLFTGNSDFLVKQSVKTWKDQFINKYGDFNLLHIKDFESVDLNFLTLNITSSSFMSEKKLVIIDIEKAGNEEANNESKTSNNKIDKLDFLLNLLDKVPGDNIILISIVNPDKRTKFYKSLLKIAEVKEFNTSDDASLQQIILNKYKQKISRQAIDTLIRYKSSNLSKISSEIEKLLINFDYIDKKEVVENIVPELEESIFQVIDNILNKQIIEAIKKISIILNDTNIYAFYNNLLANLRTSTYIFHLKNLGKNTKEIGDILDLGKKSFLIDKRYKITNNELKTLYLSLVNLDKKMKTGKLLGTEDKDLRYEIENFLLKIMSK